MSLPSVTAVVGGQYGSEGKGVIVKHLAFGHAVHVRVGGPNAGHTVFHGGRLWKLRSIPSGFVNPDAKLVLAAGAVIDPVVLEDEVAALERDGFSIRSRLTVDARALLILPEHRKASQIDIKKIGITPRCGVGTARQWRMGRDVRMPSATAGGAHGSYQLSFDVDTVDLTTWHAWGEGRDHATVLLEGTQGFGLSLIYGQWPYVTSRDCTTAQLLNDCGLPPQCVDRVVMVVRRYPIRVAGESGPLFGEFSWDHLSETLGYDVEERTTVTRRLRRIGEFDMEAVARAACINGATEIALNFMDYDHPDNRAAVSWDDLASASQRFIENLEEATGVRVRYVGTGRKGEGDDFTIIDL